MINHFKIKNAGLAIVAMLFTNFIFCTEQEYR